MSAFTHVCSSSAAKSLSTEEPISGANESDFYEPMQLILGPRSGLSWTRLWACLSPVSSALPVGLCFAAHRCLCLFTFSICWNILTPVSSARIHSWLHWFVLNKSSNTVADFLWQPASLVLPGVRHCPQCSRNITVERSYYLCISPTSDMEYFEIGIHPFGLNNC